MSNEEYVNGLLGAAHYFMGRPDDTIISGYNKDGCPILYSAKQGTSFEVIIINYGKGEEKEEI